MRARNHRRITMILGASLLTGAGLTAVACSDDAATRPSFGPPDAESEASNLPETSVPDNYVPPEPRGPFDPSNVPVVCAADAGAAACATELAAGDHHVCARMSNGTVRCWGSDEFGALGARAPRPDGGTGDAGDAGDGGKDSGTGDAGSSVTNTVYGLANVTQISASGATTCARRDDGSVVCWGNNTDGQLGLVSKGSPIVDTDPHPTPTPVTLPSAAARVDVGPASACAVLTAGPVICWGRDDQNQLARSPFDAGGMFPPVGSPAPAELASLSVTRVGSSTHSALAVTASGEAIAAFNDAVVADPRVEQVMLPLRDGVTLIRRS